MKGKPANRMRSVAAAMVLVACASFAPAQNVVYPTEGRPPIQAVRVEWRESTKEYLIEDANHAILPIPAAQVERLEIEKPAEFDQAVQLVRGRQHDAAIPLLDGLVAKYKMLVWDNRARELLAEIYLAKGDAKKAVAAIEPVLSALPRNQIPANLLRMYWKALLGAERTSTLNKELDEAIATGSRELAAIAQIMRGDIRMAEGKREEAVLDYLRTVLLFDQIKTVQPEALFKASQALDELRDPRADELKKKLREQYPASDFAKKLGA